MRRSASSAGDCDVLQAREALDGQLAACARVAVAQHEHKGLFADGLALELRCVDGEIEPAGCELYGDARPLDLTVVEAHRGRFFVDALRDFCIYERHVVRSRRPVRLR